MRSVAITRVLIANRGEIAVRIARACRELGICPVAIYGDGEEDAPHVRSAGDAYRIPAQPGVLPYLDQAAIVEIAKQAGAQAIHPGYGFLAENADFAERCVAAGLIFVGPPAPAIRAMGDKVAARRLARAAGVPVVPGSEEPVATVEEARVWAEKHGYPVAIKAAGGGGGRGFRVARSAADLPDAFAGSSGEAQRYFANPTVYLERYLERPRHIEVQIVADQHGTIVSLGERDCSIQRRHQKLIEETPSPAVGPSLRQTLGEAAIALARMVGYVSAGTVEFLLDDTGHFYFLEMNTRIQVEHPITEEVTGIDLVKEQLRIAAGLPLSFGPELSARGHAIECRINAEDAGRDFAPVPGIIQRFRPPSGPGIRVDAAMDDRVEIHPAYDSLIAKLIAWGRDRDEAIARMRRALAEFRIEGVPTTIPFHQRVMEHPVFQAGQATTTFLAEHPDVLPPPAPPATTERRDTAPARELIVEVNGRRLTVRVHGEVAAAPPVTAPPQRRPPLSGQRAQRSASSHASADGAELTSPLQGTVVRVAVTPGTPVRRGDLICVIEAMKMENEIAAHREGTVAAVHVEPGHAVRIGTVLATIAS